MMTMQSDQIIKDLMAVADDEQEFRPAIAEFECVNPDVPWKHDPQIPPLKTMFGGCGVQPYICTKCHRDFGTVYFKDIQLDTCSVPDIYTGSLAELAFELQDRVVNYFVWEGFVDDIWRRTLATEYSCSEFVELRMGPALRIIAAIAALEGSEE